MEKIINSYETLYVIDTDLTEDATKALIEKFTALINANGTVSEVNEWGKRKLAYPINDKTEGYYVLVNFTSEGSFPSELERIFGITEGILRSIVIRHEEKKTKEKAKTADKSEKAAEKPAEKPVEA